MAEDAASPEAWLTWWPRQVDENGTPWTRPKNATVGNLVDEHDWFLVNERDGPDVFVRLGRDGVSGRLVCTGLLIGDLNPFHWPHHEQLREVNAAVLRAIRIPELLAAAIRVADVPDEFGAMVRSLNERAPLAGRVARPGAAGYSDEHFAEVAKAYRAALIEAPHAPTKLLAQRLHVSLPTARRWIQRARDRGYLGPATPGRAGEQAAQSREADR